MELCLKNGDYVTDGKGGLTRVEGGEELLQRVLFRLTARRGGFPLLPELGSRLYELPRHKSGEWEMLARQYVSESLSGENELAVTDVTVTPAEKGAEVAVTLEYQGETLNIALEVGA